MDPPEPTHAASLATTSDMPRGLFGRWCSRPGRDRSVAVAAHLDDGGDDGDRGEKSEQDKEEHDAPFVTFTVRSRDSSLGRGAHIGQMP